MRSLRTAILAAEEIVKAVNSRGDEAIHAYRAFPSDRWKEKSGYSIQEIHSRFQEIGWGKGMSEGTVRNRISEILGHAEQEVVRRREGLKVYLEKRGLPNPDDTGLEAMVGNLLQAVSIPGLIGDPNRLQSRISQMIRRMVDHATAPFLRDIDVSGGIYPFAINSFMRFLCGYDTVAEARKAGELHVRPYELFLFASQQDFETKSLTRRRDDLSPDFIPKPENADILSIMYRHGGAEDDFEENEIEENRLLAEAEAERKMQAVPKKSAKKATARMSAAKHGGCE